MLINVEVEATSQKFTSTVLLTSQKKKVQGSSQEIKFQGPEEAKRRVKKKFIQVKKGKEDCERCQQ